MHDFIRRELKGTHVLVHVHNCTSQAPNTQMLTHTQEAGACKCMYMTAHKQARTPNIDTSRRRQSLHVYCIVMRMTAHKPNPKPNIDTTRRRPELACILHLHVQDCTKASPDTQTLTPASTTRAYTGL